jgi:hypothetical protein
MTLADFRLPRRARRVLAALARVVLPADVERLRLTDPVIDHFELMMRALPGHMRLGLLAGLTTFDLSAAVVPSSRGRRFAGLDRGRALAHYERWLHAPLLPMRQLAKAVKAVLAMGYFDQPVVRARLEYHPDRWIAQAARRRLDRWADAIRRHEADLVAPDPLVPSTDLLRKVRHAHHAA